MYGIIARMKSIEGKRHELINILLGGTKEMPGCKLCAIAADASDESSIWINEIWDSQEAHQASMQLPSVQEAITKGKPLIAEFGERHIVKPHGGVGVD